MAGLRRGLGACVLRLLRGAPRGFSWLAHGGWPARARGASPARWQPAEATPHALTRALRPRRPRRAQLRLAPSGAVVCRFSVAAGSGRLDAFEEDAAAVARECQAGRMRWAAAPAAPPAAAPSGWALVATDTRAPAPPSTGGAVADWLKQGGLLAPAAATDGAAAVSKALAIAQLPQQLLAASASHFVSSTASWVGWVRRDRDSRQCDAYLSMQLFATAPPPPPVFTAQPCADVYAFAKTADIWRAAAATPRKPVLGLASAASGSAANAQALAALAEELLRQDVCAAIDSADQVLLFLCASSAAAHQLLAQAMLPDVALPANALLTIAFHRSAFAAVQSSPHNNAPTLQQPAPAFNCAYDADLKMQSLLTNGAAVQPGGNYLVDEAARSAQWQMPPPIAMPENAAFTGQDGNTGLRRASHSSSPGRSRIPGRSRSRSRKAAARETTTRAPRASSYSPPRSPPAARDAARDARPLEQCVQVAEMALVCLPEEAVERIAQRHRVRISLFRAGAPGARLRRAAGRAHCACQHR